MRVEVDGKEIDDGLMGNARAKRILSESSFAAGEEARSRGEFGFYDAMCDVRLGSMNFGKTT